MKYIIELDSPDMRVLRRFVVNGLVNAADDHVRSRLYNGRGSAQTIAYGLMESAAKRVLDAIDAAISAAQPERSTGTNEGALMSDPDDMFQATSRPMGTGRRKASNLRRKGR